MKVPRTHMYMTSNQLVQFKRVKEQRRYVQSKNKMLIWQPLRNCSKGKRIERMLMNGLTEMEMITILTLNY